MTFTISPNLIKILSDVLLIAVLTITPHLIDNLTDDIDFTGGYFIGSLMSFLVVLASLCLDRFLGD